MRILVIFACTVSFIAATPVVFPDIDNNGYFAVEQVILDPELIPVGDLTAQGAENTETVATEAHPKPTNDLAILAPIAFILKPTTEAVKTEDSPSSQASSVPPTDISSTTLLLISTSTPRTTQSLVEHVDVSSSPKTPNEPCSDESSEEDSCEEVKNPPVITDEKEKDLKEKAAEVEAEPVILTPGVRK